MLYIITTTTTLALKQQQRLIMIVRNAELKLCNRRVRELCNKAAEGVYYHGKCDDSKNAFLFSGGDINTYLRSFGSGYDVDSKNGITTVANTMDEDQCHDEKCIYVLIGHGNWNQLKKPFLLCKCSKGEAARDINHVCRFITDDEQELLYDKAEKTMGETPR